MELTSKTEWKLHQMDVKTTFLNGVMEEEVYIEQPQCVEVEDIRTHVCKLKKDLKQAPRAWYGIINRFLMSLGFTKSKVGPNHIIELSKLFHLLKTIKQKSKVSFEEDTSNSNKRRLSSHSKNISN